MPGKRGAKISDLSVTAASVAISSYSQTATGTAGATITAGQSVYLDSTTSTIKLADSDASTAAASGVGVAAHGSLSGQPITYVNGGYFTPGATLAKAQIYCVSATAGGICPVADTVAATGAHPCILFVGVSTTLAKFILYNVVDTSGTQITV